MHNNSYNIKVACLGNKNFINSLDEVKDFFGFSLSLYDIDQTKSLDNLIGKYNILLFESLENNNYLLKDINVPKILIQKQFEKSSSSNNFDLVVKLPINLIELNEKIIYLSTKHKFEENSFIKINSYILDKNERVLRMGEKALKITEKEINFIETLFNSKKTLDKSFILKNIWNYSSHTDTHTVETHIYRLRQKINKTFGDQNFIKHTTKGYKL